MHLEKYETVDIECASPRAILKIASNTTIFDAQELTILFKALSELFKALSDRNLTSHSYNNELAETIIKDIPSYHQTMHTIIARINLNKNKY